VTEADSVSTVPDAVVFASVIVAVLWVEAVVSFPSPVSQAAKAKTHMSVAKISQNLFFIIFPPERKKRFSDHILSTLL
jgi:hypothetical protein